MSKGERVKHETREVKGHAGRMQTWAFILVSSESFEMGRIDLERPVPLEKRCTSLLVWSRHER